MNKRANKTSTMDKFKILLKENFSKKNNLTRLICFLIVTLIVLIPSITMNVWAQLQTVVNPFAANDFININLIINPGAGFSILANSDPWAVYLLQGAVCLLIFVVFLYTRQKTLMVLLAFGVVGALFNIFDRASPKLLKWAGDGTAYQWHSVIDYFSFAFWKHFPTFNFPDMFIVVGLIGATVYYFINTLIVMTHEQKKLNIKADKVTKKARKIKWLQKAIKVKSSVEVKAEQDEAVLRNKKRNRKMSLKATKAKKNAKAAKIQKTLKKIKTLKTEVKVLEDPKTVVMPKKTQKAKTSKGKSKTKK